MIKTQINHLWGSHSACMLNPILPFLAHLNFVCCSWLFGIHFPMNTVSKLTYHLPHQLVYQSQEYFCCKILLYIPFASCAKDQENWKITIVNCINTTPNRLVDLVMEKSVYQHQIVSRSASKPSYCMTESLWQFVVKLLTMMSFKFENNLTKDLKDIRYDLHANSPRWSNISLTFDLFQYCSDFLFSFENTSSSIRDTDGVKTIFLNHFFSELVYAYAG